MENRVVLLILKNVDIVIFGLLLSSVTNVH